MPRFRVKIGSILILIAICAVAFAALHYPSGWWAAGLLLGDFCLFTFAIMAVAYRSGGSRAFWAGFALFGWVYLVLAFGPGVREIARPSLLTTKALQKVWPEEQTFTVSVVFASSLSTGASLTTTPGGPSADGVSWVTDVSAVPIPPATGQDPTASASTMPTAVPTVPPSSVGYAVPTPPSASGTLMINGTAIAQPAQYWVTNTLVADGQSAEVAHRVGHALWALLLACIGGGIARLLFVKRPADRTEDQNRS
jgi:hypothetical protein